MISDTLYCPTHGKIDLTKAAGCPECVRELRDGVRGKNLLLESYTQQIAALTKQLKERTEKMTESERTEQARLINQRDVARDGIRSLENQRIYLQAQLTSICEAAQAVLDNDAPADWPACYRELERVLLLCRTVEAPKG